MRCWGSRIPDPIDGFIAGALDALHLDGLDQVAKTAEGWSLPRFAYESELWNGFGYRLRSIPSPYVFGGTTVQQPGKFIRDHAFSPTMMDPQLGTIAIVEKLFELDPSLKFGDLLAKVTTRRRSCRRRILYLQARLVWASPRSARPV